MRSVHHDDTGQAEINGCREEDGCDRQADEVHKKGIVVEGIGVDLQAGNVADDFEEEAEIHGDEEAIGAVSDS